MALISYLNIYITDKRTWLCIFYLNILYNDASESEDFERIILSTFNSGASGSILSARNHIHRGKVLYNVLPYLMNLYHVMKTSQMFIRQRYHNFKEHPYDMCLPFCYHHTLMTLELYYDVLSFDLKQLYSTYSFYVFFCN